MITQFYLDERRRVQNVNTARPIDGLRRLTSKGQHNDVLNVSLLTFDVAVVIQLTS